MLIRTDIFPPGGYPFFQPETDYKFKGMTDFETQARLISAHRKGNNLARSTLAECLEDLDAYTCARIGNDPRFCYTMTPNQRPTAAVVRSVQAKCGGCGARRKKA